MRTNVVARVVRMRRRCATFSENTVNVRSLPSRCYRAPVNDQDRATARRVRARLEGGAHDAASLRAALGALAPLDRDAWLDLVLGSGSPPDDGPELPRGGVPYLPCPVDALVRAIDAAAIGPADVFVDVGAGVGRAAAVVNLLTGAEVVGVDVQPALVAAAR